MSPEEAWNAINQEMLDVLAESKLTQADMLCIPHFRLAIAYKELLSQEGRMGKGNPQRVRRRSRWTRRTKPSPGCMVSVVFVAAGLIIAVVLL